MSHIRKSNYNFWEKAMHTLDLDRTSHLLINRALNNQLIDACTELDTNQTLIHLKNGYPFYVGDLSRGRIILVQDTDEGPIAVVAGSVDEAYAFLKEMAQL